MNDYNELSVGKLRKMVSQRLNNKGASIRQEGYNPAPSKTIRCMNKARLVEILETNFVKWNLLDTTAPTTPQESSKDDGVVYETKVMLLKFRRWK